MAVMTKVLLSSMNSLHRDFKLAEDRRTVLHCPEPNADVQREREREREREKVREFRVVRQFFLLEI